MFSWRQWSSSRENLSAYETFVDVACNDQGLLASAKKIKIIGDDQVADSAVRIAIRMKDGTEQENSFDLLEPLDPVLLSERLKRKARSLIGYERADELWNLVNGLDNLSAAQIADFLKT